MEIECVLGGFRVLGSAKNGIWDKVKIDSTILIETKNPFTFLERDF